MIIGRQKQIVVAMLAFSFIVGSCDYMPASRFAFAPTPENGYGGGISGVYVQKVFERCGEYSYSYEIFQFYNDGTVLDVTTCSDGDIVNDWSEVKSWFNRDNEKVAFSRGEYFIAQNQIWFSTTAYNEYEEVLITVDHSGTYSEDKLVLNIYSHYNGHRERDSEYLKIDVEQ